MMKPYLWTFVSFCLFYLSAPLIAQAEETASNIDSIQLRSDNFTLSGKIDGAQGVDMISELERFRSALLEIHGLPANSKDQRVEIYVVSDPEIFGILGVDENFIAIYSQTNAGPRALINGSAEAFDASSGSTLRHGLRHEYAHHFTRTYLRLTEPLWLAEGLAEYYAGYVENDDGSYHFGAPHEGHEVVLSYPVEGWVDMRDVLSSLGDITPARYRRHKHPRQWTQRPDNVSFLYAQSWALTHWALNNSGTNKGQTDLKAGSDRLAALVDRLIVNDMPLSRNLSLWPEQEALRVNSETRDEAIEKSVLLELGAPLLTAETAETIAETLDSQIAAYIEAGVPLLKGQPKPGRVSSPVVVETLTPAKAAAIQYRQLSLTAGTRAQIHPRMKSLKAEIEADSAAAPSLLISDAAQNFATGSTQTAVNLLAEAVAAGQLTPEDDILALNVAYGDFTNRSYQNPEAMRRKIRPALARTPEDISLLVMMAGTGIGDLIRPDSVISPEAHSALKALESLEVAKTRPLQTLPLVNLYAQQDNNKEALALLYRALAFNPSNRFEAQRIVDELERRLEPSTP